MPSASLLVLLDDIATVLDDVAVMTKLAAKKTAGVLGDDLALNAQQVSGVRAERELPVVWAVAKGSMINKFLLVPAALAISAFLPWLITPLLMLGGLYLCYEGVEKIWHSIAHKQAVAENKRVLHDALIDPSVSLKVIEKEKIKGAIRTDFILSAEIIVIALGTVSKAEFMTQVLVVSTIAAAMTIGVYGLVAFIVKLDDMGLYLMQRPGDTLAVRWGRSFGAGVLAFCPWLMKGLSVVGTAAMFLVGGGILVHGLPVLHHGFEALALPFSAVFSVFFNLLVGLIAGSVLLLSVSFVSKLKASA